MAGERVPGWLAWAREIEALAHTGQHFAQNEYDRERAERLLEIAADIVASHTSLPAADARVAFAAQPGYVTPKVDVRGAVLRDGRLLLVQEAADAGWTLPGGWADVGETPRQAVEREVREEAGVQVRATRLVGVYDANRVAGALPLFHAYKLVFLCEPISGDPTPSSETTQAGFFDLDHLPQPYSDHRTVPRHVADVIAAAQDPSRATVFD
jgi:ADP-ribose pyrophosphatase YjhB (NUDIX family)